LILLPFLSAFISWLCVFVAGKLLFLNILPRKKDQLIAQLSETISKEVSFDGITQKISDPAMVKKVMPVVEEHIDEFLRHKLKEKFPMVGMLMGEKTIDSLKEIFLKEIESLFPVILNKFAGNLAQEVDIKAMVTERLSNLPISRLEKAAFPVLGLFQAAAAIGGLLGGIAILLLS